MSKRDFKLIAGVIARQSFIGINAIAKSELVDNLADALYAQYPQFDRLKFYEACFPEVIKKGGDK